MSTTTPAAGSDTQQSKSKGLHIGLWVAQVLLAVGFGMAGGMKLFTPIAELSKNMAWVADSPALIRFIGASEVAGALGLILPAATHIKPGLTALAAAGLALIMLLAAAFHLSRGEGASVPVNLLLCGVAVFVAWGRFKMAPIAPRA